MDQVPEDGVIIRAMEWYKGLSQSDDDDSADEKEQDTGTQELLVSLRKMIVNQGNQLEKMETDLRILKVCGRMIIHELSTPSG